MPKAPSTRRAAPTAPWWLLWVGAVLAAIVGILSSIDKIQDFLCRHGVTSLCPARFALVLGTWPADVAGGWMANIANPTAYRASISDARLVFKRLAPNMPIALNIMAAPNDWKAPDACDKTEAPIPAVSISPQGTTELRLLLYAGNVRATNQPYMAAIDKLIPERLSLACGVEVDVVDGDGSHFTLRSDFDCSRLPYPKCH